MASLKHIAGPPSRISDSVSLGWAPIFEFLQVLGDADLWTVI